MLERFLERLWSKTSRGTQDEVIQQAYERGEEGVIERITGKRVVPGIGLVEDLVVIVPRVRAPRNLRYQPKKR